MVGFFSRCGLKATALVSSLAFAGAADAAQFLYTITGTTTNDVTGPNALEGATLPVGVDFTLSYLIDDALPTAQYVYNATQSAAIGGGQFDGSTRPPVTATLTVGSYSYTIRTGDFFQPYNIDPVGDPVGVTIQELDLGLVGKYMPEREINLVAGFNRNETCCGIFFGSSSDYFDRLDLSLSSPDFTSADFRETGTFNLGSRSGGSFLTGFTTLDRSEVPFASYEGVGLSATQLTVAAVPGADAWAMMIAGTGLIGASLRQRRARERAFARGQG